MLEQGVALHLCVINYAEALVKPAEAEDTLQRAVDAIASLRIALHAPDAAIARAAARLRRQNVSLADGFALATAQRLGASIASYDARVRAVARKHAVPLA
jgi:predicted nucleic acid-binding protein